jgi:hypothetical protein
MFFPSKKDSGWVLSAGIPYSKIRSVKCTKDPSGGYALSLDRIKIKHGNDIKLISPIDPHIFITELK